MSGSTNSNDSHNGSDEVEQILRLFLFSWKQENWRMWLAPWLTLLLLLVLWILAFWQAPKTIALWIDRVSTHSTAQSTNKRPNRLQRILCRLTFCKCTKHALR